MGKGNKPRCGAGRKYDGQPCQAAALASGRCKLHGGMSTGPRSLTGKIKSLAHLRPFAGCKAEILAVADIVETETMQQDIFDRLLENESPYSDSAVRKIAAYLLEDLQREKPVQENRHG